jgi:RNA polymerase sigma-B factor
VELAKARDHLTNVLDAPPTVAELAAYLGITDDEVIEGLVAANGYTAGSIDLPIGGEEGDESGRTYADTVGVPDPALELMEDFHVLAPMLHKLDEREQTLLRLRFAQEMTQAEIGAELGYSQMHISRMLSRTLTKLRAGMLTDR